MWQMIVLCLWMNWEEEHHQRMHWVSVEPSVKSWHAQEPFVSLPLICMNWHVHLTSTPMLSTCSSKWMSRYDMHLQYWRFPTCLPHWWIENKRKRLYSGFSVQDWRRKTGNGESLWYIIHIVRETHTHHTGFWHQSYTGLQTAQILGLPKEVLNCAYNIVTDVCNEADGQHVLTTLLYACSWKETDATYYLDKPMNNTTCQENVNYCGLQTKYYSLVKPPTTTRNNFRTNSKDFKIVCEEKHFINIRNGEISGKYDIIYK